MGRQRTPAYKRRRLAREASGLVALAAVHAVIGRPAGAACHPQNSGEFLSSVGTPIGAAGPVEEVTERVSA